MTFLFRTRRRWRISSCRRSRTSCARCARSPRTDMAENDRPSEAEQGRVDEGQTPHQGWQYLGVGCVTAVAGLFGGGMIAVLVAKIVGAVRGCKPEAETGAPCDWTTYWAWGARIGLVALPALAIWLLRRG